MSVLGENPAGDLLGIKEKVSMKRLIGLGVCWGIAVLLFWLVFFKLTPIIITAIPSGEWQSLVKILVYVVVGCLGGIGLPLVFFVVGIDIALLD